MDGMIHEHLAAALQRRRCTLLGVGPMSTNCVDAAIEIANQSDIPIILIASRRQIEAEEFGGGYVNNWTTDQFAQYVGERDRGKNVVLARDHGGPWQNGPGIPGLGFRGAMEAAKASFRADLDAGFQILHIDPSLDPQARPTVQEVLERIFELYEFCWSYAKQIGRDVIFEIGTEEQSGSTNSQDDLEVTLDAVRQFTTKNRMTAPSFVVVQTGTRVMETRNVGSFDTPIRVADELPAEIQVPRMIEICRRFGIMMKEHNADYLSDEALQWHPRLGIHAANVAPEFGVTETRALLRFLEENGDTALAEKFLQLAYDSRKWEKWMLENSLADVRERAIIAGHYVFAHPECVELKEKASRNLEKKGIDLDAQLKGVVKDSIMRYVRNFRLVKAA